MKAHSLLSFFALIFFLFPNPGRAQQLATQIDKKNKVVVFGNNKMILTLDYNQKCNISCLEVNGQKVIEGTSGIFSRIKTVSKTYSTLKLDSSPEITVTRHSVSVKGINFGDADLKISEDWTFTITDRDIVFTVERTIPKAFAADEVSFPSFNFSSINTWEGAFLESGGLAWFYLFTGQKFTYGVHSNYSAFWNSKTGNGLKIDVSSSGKQIAGSYTRSMSDQLVYEVTVSDSEMIPRYDADTHRRLFIRGESNVWSGFEIPEGKDSQTITLTPFDYQTEYNRGKFVGIDGARVTSVMNTIARIGVIDSRHFGGNSWHTPYGPLCLHEQYIAQFGIGINDERYLNGYKQCLDFYRDNAVTTDGRVISRWAYENGDAMPGTVSPKGFYEAQWGYLMDSNPDYVINVSELYNQCGDIAWVKGQRSVCESALDYMLKRDSNGNHLVEMMTGNHSDRKGSDWIDIIWASFENAFVNAELYRALVLWSDIEGQLGNPQKADYYSNYAEKLKISFNKPTGQGGFWDQEKQCYIHWRDKDNSIHGNNLVTPVNFMAIAYGICDDKSKSAVILDQIEAQMQKENLFFWPICMFSYQPGEGNDWQFPFPNYENGDIFLSWGSVAVQAYAGYKPELAVKYVKNVLSRQSQDGLAFQRYGRINQDGLGDDILSGNSMAVIGLYQFIYGINPLHDRLYLNPRITRDLAGTELIYNFRGEKLNIGLDIGENVISNKQFRIASKGDFGFSAGENEMKFYHGNEDTFSLKATTQGSGTLVVEITGWSPGLYTWNQSSAGGRKKVKYILAGMKPDQSYAIQVDGLLYKMARSGSDGILGIELTANSELRSISVGQY
jgi:hypothetical protein